jgi:hypothetical protein
MATNDYASAYDASKPKFVSDSYWPGSLGEWGEYATNPLTLATLKLILDQKATDLFGINKQYNLPNLSQYETPVGNQYKTQVLNTMNVTPSFKQLINQIPFVYNQEFPKELATHAPAGAMAKRDAWANYMPQKYIMAKTSANESVLRHEFMHLANEELNKGKKDTFLLDLGTMASDPKASENARYVATMLYWQYKDRPNGGDEAFADFGRFMGNEALDTPSYISKYYKNIFKK